MLTTSRRGTIGEPSTLKSSTGFCAASLTVMGGFGLGWSTVTLWRTSMPTRQVPMASIGRRFAPEVVLVKTPLASGSLSAHEPPSVIDGVSRGTELPPKSVDGPLIANALRPRAHALVLSKALPAPSVILNWIVTGPPGVPDALTIVALSPWSWSDRSGIVCAWSTPIPNSGNGPPGSVGAFAVWQT